MKRFFCYIIFVGSFTMSYAQNRPIDNQIKAAISEKERWNLDKYVWSHTHYQTGKSDKSVIDFDALDNWQTLGGNISVSPNGQYIAYTLNRGCGIPAIVKNDSLIVQSTDNKWRMSFIGIQPGFFSSDNKQYTFQDNESLCFLKINSNEIRKVEGVSSYKLPGNRKNQWVAYQLKGSEVVLQNLVSFNKKVFENASAFNFDNSSTWLACQLNNKDLQLYNLKTGRQFTLSSVASYQISNEGKCIVSKNTEGELSFTDLSTAKTISIWQPLNTKGAINQFSLDGKGSQIVFTVKDENNNNSIWYWKGGMDKAVAKVDNKANGIEGLLIQPSVSFTDNSKYIQFSLEPKADERNAMEDAVQLDIWSSQDKVLQSNQPSLLKKTVSFKAVVNLDNGSILRLEKGYEKLYLQQGDFALIKKAGSGFNGDRFWEDGYHEDSNWLVSLRDGSRCLLPVKAENNTFWFSPGGSYLVYFDAEKGDQYFSYDLRTQKIAKISGGVPDALLRHKFELLPNEKAKEALGIAAWLEGDYEVLVYDDYDIWELDLTGKSRAINLTNGYGNLHKIKFCLLYKGSFFSKNKLVGQQKGYSNAPVLSKGEPVILLAFSKQTKYNGYYKKYIGTKDDPELLYMGPCFFQGMNELNLIDRGMLPMKAEDANVWIVQRQTATDAPNYFSTKDFKTYTRLTNLQPQKGYNWLTTELHSFRKLDGTLSQGVLYKPENFDSTKKYPVIITFYGHLSDRLYQYPSTEYIMYPTIFNQPSWMVSHGYLVFMPDIQFKKDGWGPSTINTMDGAAKYLSQLPYVDGKRIGAAGHSNSGRLGYYLLTHSISFAAMSIGAGTTDMISGALKLDGASDNQLYWAEENAFGSGLGTLWENKQRWLDHTAVLNADKVTSPVLIFHNKPDGAFDPGMAIEMYLALWRLEKKAWWLDYNQEGHFLDNPKDLKDFTIRYTQFFDYYLKDAPAPKWMTNGIPYSLKGIESRYELDPSGTCALSGKPCPICKAWNKQYKRNPAMFEKPNSEWKMDKDIEEEMTKKETQRYNENMKGEAQRIKENNEKLKGTWKGEPY